MCDWLLKKSINYANLFTNFAIDENESTFYT